MMDKNEHVESLQHENDILREYIKKLEDEKLFIVGEIGDVDVEELIRCYELVHPQVKLQEMPDNTPEFEEDTALMLLQMESIPRYVVNKWVEKEKVLDKIVEWFKDDNARIYRDGPFLVCNGWDSIQMREIDAV